MLRVPCGFFPYDCTSHATSKETLFPLTWAAQRVHQAAGLIMQQGKQEWKNPCCWKEGSWLGWSEPAMLSAATSVPFGGQETGWLQVKSHSSSPEQSSGNQTSHPTRLQLHCGGCFAVPAALSTGTTSKWPHRSYQCLTADFSEKASQLGVLSSHPSFPMDGLNWHYSGEFGGTPLISPAERFYYIGHVAVAYSYEIHQETSMFLPCFHKNIFLVFPEILIHYLSKILWPFPRTWPAVFPSGSLLTIMSFSVHIQLDTLQLCAFQWLPNVH